MPSRGGKNRPLPVTRERLNTAGQHDSAAPHQDGRPLCKAAQEGKAAKDTEGPLVKLEQVVELLDRRLLSVCEYELLKQHILTDLLSTALGWPATAQDAAATGVRGAGAQEVDSFFRGLQRLEIWTGKSQAPDRFGILLRLSSCAYSH